MANVTNNHHGPLAVGGVTIAPGKTAKVEKWDTVKSNAVVQAWIDRGVISSDDAPKGGGSGEEKPLDHMNKTELVATAEARGVTLAEGATKAEILAILKG